MEWAGGVSCLGRRRVSPPPLPSPLPFPKLRSSCSPQRGPRAATLQFGEGEGGGEDGLVVQNAAGLILCLQSLQAHGFLQEATRNSATGTRTRVARVRAEYPNQLDYSGFW